ncbi:MAG TPA: hypothetical protein VEX36_08285 [Thermoleophilaceae bacterium]|nr:hypothetical protein [Thermoleophilaceae bacterium]
MFPHLRQQILARVDLLVELSTLGEYGVDEQGGVMRLDAEPTAVRIAPRVRDRCAERGQQAPCPAARGRTLSARS